MLATKEMGGKGSTASSTSAHTSSRLASLLLPTALFPPASLLSLAPLPFVILTNGGGVSEAKKAEELSSWFDLRIPPSIVCVSHTPMQSLLPAHRHSRILVLGMSDVAAVARAYGFTDVVTVAELAQHHPELVPHLVHEDTGGEHVHRSHPHTRDSASPLVELSSIKAVFVMHDPNVSPPPPLAWLSAALTGADSLPSLLCADVQCWYRDMQILLDVMTASDPPPSLTFTNGDFLFTGRSSSPRLAQGAFRIAFAQLYREYTGHELRYAMMGKPTEVTYQHAGEMMRRRAKEMGFSGVHQYVMIGDNPYADIRGGNQAGWTTVMVKTGTIAPSTLATDQPTHVADNVLEAVKWIAQQEAARTTAER